MKVQVSFPWAADKAVGEIVSYYGVPFTVTESDSASCVAVADLPADEAQAMADAGRCTMIETKVRK